MKRLCTFLVFLLTINLVFSQEFTREDSLRGNLTSLRGCYDVAFYDLFVMIDDQELSIENSYNIIHFTAISDFIKIQIDLFYNMEVQKIEFEGQELDYSREYNAVYVMFPRIIKEKEKGAIKVYYGGYPVEAVNPPWDGGFSWENDSNGNPWIAVSCQGLGASSWWPCKDHQSDEPDSMRITCIARYPWKIISNGNLRNDTSEWNQYLNSWVNKTEWFVSYPINNYNVTLCIGDYVHFSDKYISGNDTMDMDYYVLHDNLEKAQEHFRQVKPMMECFEKYFGDYPFLDDGYALVETPYLGMEHQSAIAYGNNFLSGYNGNRSFINDLDFDYIIVHETGHEWWGNSITTNDIADMWVHEGFCTYSEALYVECMYDYETMLAYVNSQKKRVRNDKKVLGSYHVNNQGSSDMYFKGSLMLNTLRSWINNDGLWFEMIKDMTVTFKHQTVDGQEIIDYISNKLDKDLDVFFRQYLEHSNIPELQYKIQKEGKNYTLLFRWEAIPGFNMPVLINTGSNDFWIHPNNIWQELDLGAFDKYNFEVRDDLFFINVKKL